MVLNFVAKLKEKTVCHNKNGGYYGNNSLNKNQYKSHNPIAAFLQCRKQFYSKNWFNIGVLPRIEGYIRLK